MLKTILNTRVVKYLFATLVFLSCESNNSYPDSFIGSDVNIIELDYDNDANKGNYALPVSIFFDENSIDFITFQPNNKGEGLVVLPRTVIHLENRNWLVYDQLNDVSNALLFNENGKFIKYIGTKGKGPGEYINAGYCKLNRIKEQIEILDAFRSIMLYFDYNGNFKRSISLPLLFTDIIQDPDSEGYFAYTLNNYNSYYMNDFGLKNDFVITKTDSLYRPLIGIETVKLTPDITAFKINGNNLFYYKDKVGFINNYSNDLYLIDKHEVESLISFRINGIPFQSPEFIKVGQGDPFKKTTDAGYGYVLNLTLSNSRLQEEIMLVPENSNKKYDIIYLNYSFETNDHIFYNALEDSSGTFTIGRYYLDPDSPEYDAFAVIQPKDIEDMDENNHPTRHKILSMLKENNNNPIIARLKFKER